MLDHTLTNSNHTNLADLRQQLDAFTSDSILHWLGTGGSSIFPRNLSHHLSLHRYVRDHWSRRSLSSESTGPDQTRMPQDMVILDAIGPARAKRPFDSRGPMRSLRAGALTAGCEASPPPLRERSERQEDYRGPVFQIHAAAVSITSMKAGSCFAFPPGTLNE